MVVVAYKIGMGATHYGVNVFMSRSFVVPVQSLVIRVGLEFVKENHKFNRDGQVSI